MKRHMDLILKRFVVICLYAVLFVPLAFEQQLMHPLVMAKTVLFQGIVMTALAGYILLAVRDKKVRPRLTPLFMATLAVFGAIVISGVFAINPWRSIWSLPERMTGIVLMAHLFAYFAMLSGMGATLPWGRYIKCSLIVSFLVALFPVIQLIAPSIFFDRIGERLSGTIGNPIFLAAYLFFHVFIAGYYALYERKVGRIWWPYAVCGLFELLVIALTETRGAMVAFAVSCVILSYSAVRGRHGVRARRTALGVWAVVLCFLGVFWATYTSSVWQSIPVLSRVARDGFSASNRLYAWNAGIEGFLERPITGAGWDNFYIVFNEHYNPRLLRSGFNETFFDRPHNVFVQFLAETGIIGLVAYFVLLFLAFREARKKSLFLVAMLGAYVAQNFFAFDSVSSYIAFFMVLAWLDSNSEGSEALLEDGGRFGYRDSLVLFITALTAIFGIYYFDYRLYAASHAEWMSINYFVHGEMPEGVEWMRKALMMPIPYRSYMAKDLYPNIALLYKQNMPLPDVRNLVREAVRGMTEAAEAEPLNYGFWIGLADMMQPIASLDADYINQGLRALDRAAALSPKRQATEYVRAKLLNLKGDRKGALQAMADAVALDPEVGDAHFFYGLLLLESGDRARGAEELMRASALGREPKSAEEASALGAQLGDLGAYKESIVYFSKALLMKPGDLELTMKLGLVYYFDGQKDPARRLIGEVMKKDDLSRSPQYSSLLPILRDLGLEK